MMVNRAVVAAALCAFCCNASAAAYRVIGVADGDTITVLGEDKQMVKCRLYGIDAPEKAQAYGAQSKASLSELTFQRIVDIRFAGSDRYGRSICKITVDGLDINREQLVRGMAWVYRRYTDDASYGAAELAARTANRGLWHDIEPVPPWQFRRLKSSISVH